MRQETMSQPYRKNPTTPTKAENAAGYDVFAERQGPSLHESFERVLGDPGRAPTVRTESRAHQVTYLTRKVARTARTENRINAKRLAASWCVRVAVLAIGCTALATDAIAQDKRIIHDAEHYLLEAQHGEKWAAEDKVISAKLAELKKKHGRRPNLIHIMWDDTALGEIGIP